MAQTDLDVCNLAIARIGGERIEAIGEDTPLGAYCQDNYPARRDFCLARYRWVFATAAGVQLARLDDVAAGPRRYRFAMPSDLLGAVHAFRVGGRGADELLPVLQTAGETASSPGVVWSDNAVVFAEYTKRVTEAVWPPSFRELVRVSFAADLADMNEQRTKARELRMEAWGDQDPSRGEGGLFLIAMQDDSRNAPQRNLNSYGDDCPLVDIRGGLVGPWAEQAARYGVRFIDFD